MDFHPAYCLLLIAPPLFFPNKRFSHSCLVVTKFAPSKRTLTPKLKPLFATPLLCHKFAFTHFLQSDISIQMTAQCMNYLPDPVLGQIAV
ncbi:hypothetical protein ACTXT7_008925 [Hymenolepis weldensis]